MSELHPIFAECCDPNYKRYDISRPFVRGEWICATDGRILVRCPRAGIEWPDEPDRKVPKAESIFDDISRTAFPLPECEGPKPCPECKGTGVNASGEIVCEESGIIFPILRHGKPVEIDCEVCDGEGSGFNFDGPIRSLLVRDTPRYYLGENYAWLLRKHGVGEIHVPDSTRYTALYFVGDGFDGWLMPHNTERVEAELQDATA